VTAGVPCAFPGILPRGVCGYLLALVGLLTLLFVITAYAPRMTETPPAPGPDEQDQPEPDEDPIERERRQREEQEDDQPQPPPARQG
jgi:hypothetical protein